MTLFYNNAYIMLIGLESKWSSNWWSNTCTEWRFTDVDVTRPQGYRGQLSRDEIAFLFFYHFLVHFLLLFCLFYILHVMHLCAWALTYSYKICMDNIVLRQCFPYALRTGVKMMFQLLLQFPPGPRTSGDNYPPW
mgnify:FL=1